MPADISPQVADGTPRDCSSNGCGSQADTSIIRDRELGTNKASALGRTEGNGPVDASAMIANFMDGAAAPTNKGAASSSGVEDDLSGLQGATSNKRGVFGDFLSSIAGGGGKGTKSEQAVEKSVAASAGQVSTLNYSMLPVLLFWGMSCSLVPLCSCYVCRLPVPLKLLITMAITDLTFHN